METQMMKQLVTLNETSKEHGEYLHTIMTTLNDIQEKQTVLNNQPSTTDTNLEFEKMYQIFPISNEDSLNNVQIILSNDVLLYDKTVSNKIECI